MTFTGPDDSETVHGSPLAQADELLNKANIAKPTVVVRMWMPLSNPISRGLFLMEAGFMPFYEHV
jgi:hypothetical protein